MSENTNMPLEKPQAVSNIVPEGVYAGRILRAEFKSSNKKAEPFIEFMCEIIAEGHYKGRRMDCTYFFNTKPNAERGMNALLIAGWDGESDPMEPVGIGSKVVDLVIQHEEPQAKEDGTGFYPVRSRVAFINEQGSSVVGRLMNEQEKTLFGAKLMALKVTMNIGARSTPSDVKAQAAQQAAPTQAAAQTAPATGKFDKF